MCTRRARKRWKKSKGLHLDSKGSCWPRTPRPFEGFARRQRKRNRQRQFVSYHQASKTILGCSTAVSPSVAKKESLQNLVIKYRCCPVVFFFAEISHTLTADNSSISFK
jgi:hypothetical protein